MTQKFIELECVENVLRPIENSNIADKLHVIRTLRQDLLLQVVPASHGDHVSRLPKDAVSCGESKRGKNEIWFMGSNVLCV